MPPQLVFEVTCVLGKQVRATEKQWRSIIEFKHPSMAGREAEVQRALTNADQVRQSKSDQAVKLYYRASGTNYLCVVVRHLNGDGSLITAYFTTRIKEGAPLWTKS